MAVYKRNNVWYIDYYIKKRKEERTCKSKKRDKWKARSTKCGFVPLKFGLSHDYAGNGDQGIQDQAEESCYFCQNLQMMSYSDQNQHG